MQARKNHATASDPALPKPRRAPPGIN